MPVEDTNRGDCPLGESIVLRRYIFKVETVTVKTDNRAFSDGRVLGIL